MAFIKAKNGNVVEFDDDALGVRAIKDGHEVFEDKALKKKWEPAADKPAEDSE